MRSTAKIALVVGVASLLLLSIVFIPARPSPPPIRVFHIKSIRSDDGVSATFEITNHTARTYSVNPISVEVSNGPVWKACADFGSQSFPIDELDPHSSESRTFYMTNLPTSSPLRLRLSVSEQLTGLKGRFACLEWSLVNHKNLLVPLNPFQTNFKFPRSIEILSDEFVEPDSHHADQGALEK